MSLIHFLLLLLTDNEYIGKNQKYRSEDIKNTYFVKLKKRIRALIPCALKSRLQFNVVKLIHVVLVSIMISCTLVQIFRYEQKNTHNKRGQDKCAYCI